MFKAIIFDFDGTLADTKELIIETMQKTLAKAGCNVDENFIARRIGIGARALLKEALEHKKIPYNNDFIEELIDSLIVGYTKLSDRETLFDRTIDLLNELHGKIRMALATMSTRKAVTISLQNNGLKKYFEVVITADDVENPKPDPEIFLKCAEKMGLEPKDCVVVEDSVFGVKAAKKAGMKCIAVTTGSYTAEEHRREGVDLIVPSINEKEELLKFIF